MLTFDQRNAVYLAVKEASDSIRLADNMSHAAIRTKLLEKAETRLKSLKQGGGAPLKEIRLSEEESRFIQQTVDEEMQASHPTAAAAAATTSLSATIDWTAFKNGTFSATKKYLAWDQGGAEGKLRARAVLRALEAIPLSNPVTAAQQIELTKLICAIVFESSSDELRIEIENEIGSALAINHDQGISTRYYLKKLQFEQNIEQKELEQKEQKLHWVNFNWSNFSGDVSKHLTNLIGNKIIKIIWHKSSSESLPTEAVPENELHVRYLGKNPRDGKEELEYIAKGLKINTSPRGIDSFSASGDLKNVGVIKDKILTIVQLEGGRQGIRLQSIIDQYIVTLEPDNTEGRERAQNFKQALIDLRKSDTNKPREFLKLVYLLSLTTSAKLLDRVLGEIGLTKEVLSDLVHANNFENRLGDFKNFSDGKVSEVKILKSDGDIAFGDDVEADKTYNQNFAPSFLINFIESQSKLAIIKYLQKDNPDELGKARAVHLLMEIEKIKNSAQSENEKAKQLIELTCAIVFKSRSKKLRDRILAETSTLPNNPIGMPQLKKLQHDFKISEHTAWQKAQEINQKITIPNWDTFRDQIIKAANAYRNVGLAQDIKGRLRAEKCIATLVQCIPANTHERRYQIILMAYALSQSRSKQLKSAMLDFISQIKIDEIDEEALKRGNLVLRKRSLKESDLEQLAIQYGITDKTHTLSKIKSKSVDTQIEKLEGEEKDEKERDSLQTVDIDVLKEQLKRAAKLCLATSNDDVERKNARILQIVIDQQQQQATHRSAASGPAVNGDEVRTLLLALAANYACSDKPGLLGDEILACMLQREVVDLYNFKQDSFQNNTMIAEAEKQFISEKSSPSSTSVVADWNKFRDDLLAALDSYEKDKTFRFRKGPEGELRAASMKRLISAMKVDEHGSLTEADKKRLALLACTVTLHSGSEQLRDKILLHTGMSEYQMGLLQKESDISDETCRKTAEKLESESEALSLVFPEVDGKFKQELIEMVKDYVFTTLGSAGENWKGRLSEMLTDQALMTAPAAAAAPSSAAISEADKRKIAVIACTIALHLPHDSTLRLRIVDLPSIKSIKSADKSYQFRLLQLRYGITDEECKKLHETLNKKPTQITAQTLFVAPKPTAPTTGPSLACPMNNYTWDEFREHLIDAAADINKSHSPESDVFTNKQMAHNLALELAKLDDQPININNDAEQQITLVKLVHTIFYLVTLESNLLRNLILEKTGAKTADDFKTITLFTQAGIKKPKLACIDTLKALQTPRTTEDFTQELTRRMPAAK